MEIMELNKIKFKNFWKKKKVFITGHTGFKGGWLSLWLNILGAEVKGYSLQPTSKKNFYYETGLNNIIQSEYGNILNKKKLNQSINKFKPEIIFHLAAQSLVIDSYLDPIKTYKTNVIGTLNLLNIIQTSKGIKAFINITSDKCYENPKNKNKLSENDQMGGHDPYSSSKGCVEILTASIRRSFFSDNHQTSIATVRAGNVIGGGDWSKNRLIPDIVRKISKDKNIILRNPISVRPWQFVLDPLFGYMILATKLYNNGHEYSEAWNFGPGLNDNKNVKWIATKLLKKWNSKNIRIISSKSMFHEEKLLYLNSKKALSKLKWKTFYDVDKTLNVVVDWYKSSLNKENMLSLSQKQINDYMQNLFH